jgi:ribonuclease J
MSQNQKGFFYPDTLPAVRSLKDLKGLHFLPLGGSGEIGMNLNAYGYEDQWIIVDCGISFSHKPDRVLAPDPCHFLNMIPKEFLKAIVLTHAHEDHVGGIPYLNSLLPDVPIYATPFTAFLLEGKARDFGLELDIREVPLSGGFSVGPFDISYILLTHSIPEPNAVLIKTPTESIIHTGDWKISYETLVGQSIQFEKLKALGDQGIQALVCDSTTVFEEGFSGSEVDVCRRLSACVDAHPTGRVVIACFASNIERLLSCWIAAKGWDIGSCLKKEGGVLASQGKRASSVERHPILVGRSLLRMERAARHCGYFDEKTQFLDAKEASGLPASQQLIIATGSQAEPRAALTAMARGQHPFIHLNKGDTVIFSCRVIPGNEEVVFALQNQLTLQGINVVTSKQAGEIHVSGHPYRGELKQMYEWTRPRISVPVHGEARHIDEHARFAESLGVPHSVKPHNGMLICLSGEKPEVIGYIGHGRLMVDGTRLIPWDGEEIQQRQELLEKGVVFITLLLSRCGKKILSTKISFKGLFEQNEQAYWSQEIKNFLSTQKPDPEKGALPSYLSMKLNGFLYHRIGKNPTIIIHTLFLKR